ncbi:type III polyketide synthase [Heliophilum fasciatum]|uniref:15-methylpalmitoyl-4-hydroxy-2-pyrone synthase n=1 Tax=Heliophilum fasciatum TaxID=35700 RepID=A0A4R2S159_9FIRM|nr:3-oxoacyl-[acyl-carrier-protein] synthase III C-terminal domain-containing protein [Heliophilum fasciatum]MCW2276682.1 alkylresorcinol/alkylpyrone synthase [Heliophilum fasciatum]TCP68937.1 15-methylpalmitoyl-4-hydroxy-2-pyrone synthase [Heliophilum fasciatum]
MPQILSVGTAVPPYCVDQAMARRFAHSLFASSFADIGRLLTVFEHSQIEERYFCVPTEWFEKPHDVVEKNRLYEEHAVALAATAIETCLAQAGVAVQDVDTLLCVSSTGIATPTIDIHIANKLGMSPHLHRLPLWGLGCAGGVAGIARAAEMARAYPGRYVLLVTVELCGLTFIWDDRSKSNLIATSLFSDGAAAVLIAHEPMRRRGHGRSYGSGTEAIPGHSRSRSLRAGPEIIDCQSTRWPGTGDVMGWQVTEQGLKVVFSRQIPQIVRTKWAPVVKAFIAGEGLGPGDVRRVIAHPGGLRVIEAYEAAMGWSAEDTAASRAVLRHYGNMSSATVLFVLAKALADPPPPGSYGLMTALGPGFCSELALLRW